MRANKLYKTGHFHWKEAAMLNWIDTSYFFNKKEEMQLITQAIFKRFKNVIKPANYIVGFGIKGSIILSYVRYCFPGISCSYYPDSAEGHNKYEKELLSKAKKEKVVLLTDVVHSGKSIKEFILANRVMFSKNATLDVITIFHTNPDRGIIDCVADTKIELHYLVQVQVCNCTGSGKSCPIYKQKLVPVYEYEEKNN